MLITTFSAIAAVLEVQPLQQHSDPIVDALLTDSRKLVIPATSLFFSISTHKKNANEFILSLYEKGVRCFVLQGITDQERDRYPEANILIVKDVVAALQRIAASRRQQFSYPVIGITGSNGKTIVKEWLYQLLEDKYHIIRSPKSYNSQVGVPLSIWQMDDSYDLAIFEAGISLPSEMQRLQAMIDPDIGVFTFLGEAHDEGFENRDQKLLEKLALFAASKCIIYCADEPVVHNAMLEFAKRKNIELCSWGKSTDSQVRVHTIASTAKGRDITCEYQHQHFSFSIPFSDEASLHNAITCASVLLFLGTALPDLIREMSQLRPLAMRLELKQGMNNCSIINDSYSADINSFNIALDFLDQQHQHSKRTVVLSDMLGSKRAPAELYEHIAAILAQKNLFRFIGIGPAMKNFSSYFRDAYSSHFFSSTNEFLEEMPGLQLRDETILLKGARVFGFERISKALEQKLHGTVLEINLNALRHNIRAYQQKLQPHVRLMAMVKAFSYGSGSFEIAGLLQHAGVDYLGVAYADEGVELRKAGIRLPIMVMNTEEAGFDAIVKHHLQPELYSFTILRAFRQYLRAAQIKNYPVHIKYDTGMHRLGFEPAGLAELCDELQAAPEFQVQSVFSHLAASGEAVHDAFTNQQGATLVEAATAIETAIGYTAMKHIANTAAIHRHPHLQMDMVRLGIGMYGVDEDPEMMHLLQNVTTLKTTISQLKTVEKGESVGYGRAAVADKEMRIATVRVGYADGYPRRLSNGAGSMMINGQLAPVVGKVCMDMTMLDVTSLTVAEEDEVIVFGKPLPVSLIATWANTIPYEILTNISQRVRRVYFEE